MRRWIQKAGAISLGVGVTLGVARPALSAQETSSTGRPLCISPFRKYFWGARKAFEQRHFQEAERLFKTYQRLGTPPDPLVDQSGCRLEVEVGQFAALLKKTQACLAQKKEAGKSWTDFDKAKLAVMLALENGTAGDLAPYVECAPVDLTFQGDYCTAQGYADPKDLGALLTGVRVSAEILEEATWTYYPASELHDAVSPPWVLHTHSLQWTPAQMHNAGLIGLRQNPQGEVHIAGFAASGVGATR